MNLFIKTFTDSKYIKNTLWVLLERGASLVLTLISFLVLARFLGPIKFGELSYALSFVAMLSPLSLLAYDTVVVKQLSKQADIKRTLKTALHLRLLGASLIYLLIIMLAQMLNFEITIIGVIGLGLFCESYLIYESYFQYTLKSKLSSIAKLVSSSLGSGSRIFLVIFFPNLIWISITYVVEKVITSTILHYLFRRSFTDSEQRQSTEAKKYTSRLFLESLPLIMTNLLILINFKVDQILIESLLGTASVGIYASAARFSEVWYIIPTSILISYFPYIVQNIDNSELIKRKLSAITAPLIMSAILLASIVSLFADKGITFLLGHEYKQGGVVLAIHIWASVFFFAGHSLSKVLIAKNKSWIHFSGKLMAAVLNIILNLILIPRYGIEGAAIATLISYAIGYYFYYLLFKVTRGLAVHIALSPFREAVKLIALFK